MTKEELRAHCEKQVKMCEEWAKGNDREPSGKIYEEHKLILDLIKALEQQPSDDKVSVEVYKQVTAERDIAIEQLRELGYSFGEKIRTSDDCVSRADLYKILKLFGEQPLENDIATDLIYLVKDSDIVELPTVKPTRKVGKWVFHENWRCSICNKTPKIMGFCGTSYFMKKEFKFCNYCGAEMRGSENEENI